MENFEKNKLSRHVYGPNATAFFAGVIAGAVFFMAMLLCRAIGVSSFSLPLLLGSQILKTGGLSAWVLGTVIHLLGTGITGWIYGEMFYLTGRAGWRIGAL